MSDGEAAVIMLKARIAGKDYPPDGVEDTPRNKALWDAIGHDLSTMPPGMIPEIPADYTTAPD